MATKYIKSSASGAALIRMPTGTGKSGVIAVLTRCFPKIKNVLVLTPWAFLRDQMIDDIKERFWQKIKFDASEWSKNIVRLLPSNIDKLLSQAKKENMIFVSTIPALQQIYSTKNKKKFYKELSKLISLIIVDEGHREPSPEWAKMIRDQRKKTILFTATPYRNDHKVFNINPNYIYAYTHQKAVKEHFIREVKFCTINFGSNAETFVESLLTFYNKFKKRKHFNIKHPKVIIRCDNSDDVNKIAGILKKKGKSVIGIHETFSTKKDDFLTKTVEKPEMRKETFWIHQYKLIEGIDDPSFCLLAIYQPFKNARMLVQQVGRIIRNPPKTLNQTAFVLTNSIHHQDRFWNAYRKYEVDFEKNPTLNEYRQLFDLALAVQPDFQYFEDTYRRRFDIESKQLYKKFRYPLTATIFSPRKKFTKKALEESIKKEWFQNDLDIRRIDHPNSDTTVLTYITFRNAPILLEHSFLEFDIGFTIYHLKGELIFFYDVFNNYPSYLLDKASRLNPTKLQSLFRGKNARLTQINLLNTDLGRQSIRQRTFRAFSIAETAPGLSDHAHFCSTAQGYTDIIKGVTRRRYIGFSKSRITEPSTLKYEYADYIHWLSLLAKEIQQQNIEPLQLFDRFASFADEPEETEPINILLDIHDALELYITTVLRKKGKKRNKGVGQSLEINDLCYDVKNNYFELIANNNKFQVNVKYDNEKTRYLLSSPELDRAYVRQVSTEDNVGKSLITYLNKNQSFRIVPKSSGVIYAHSHFYEPRLPLWGKVKSNRLDLLKLLIPIFKLSQIRTEKGSPGTASGKGWDPNSLFHLIDSLGSNTNLAKYMRGISILICDDMDKEVADFIAVNPKKKRVIFIHAKAFSDEKFKSASHLQDVCFQAVKNLEYLHPLSFLKPPRLQTWNKRWKASKIGYVDKRIRMGSGSPQDIWGTISDLVRDPASSREVWIILGRGLSKSAFNRARNKPKPEPQIVQMLYIIQSTWSAVSSIGASLKIFCSP